MVQFLPNISAPPDSGGYYDKNTGVVGQYDAVGGGSVDDPFKSSPIKNISSSNILQIVDLAARHHK